MLVRLAQKNMVGKKGEIGTDSEREKVGNLIRKVLPNPPTHYF